MRVAARVGLGTLAVVGVVVVVVVVDAATPSRVALGSLPTTRPTSPATVGQRAAMIPLGQPAPCEARRAPTYPVAHALAVAAATDEVGPGGCVALDLDADGTADRLEEVRDSCGTGGCVYRAYLVRSGGIDRFVGTLDGKYPFVLVPGRRNLVDVVSRWRLGAGQFALTRYRFDGRSYRAIRNEDCTRRGCRVVE